MLKNMIAKPPDGLAILRALTKTFAHVKMGSIGI